MNACSNWADAITDCALGKSPDPDLAAHLVICPQCQNALRDSQAMAARVDQALHRGAAVEPPLYGPERVMARIGQQTEKGQTYARAWWKWAAVGSAVLAMLIAIVMWVGRPAPEPDIAALSAWRSPTEALLRPPVAAAWTTRPRLGESFFKLNPSGETHVQ